MPDPVQQTDSGAAASQPSGTPMISPDFTSTKLVPADQVDAARAIGWDNAIKMQGPQGEMKWAPASRVADMRAANYAPVSQPGVQPMVDQQGNLKYAAPSEVEGFLNSGHAAVLEPAEMGELRQQYQSGKLDDRGKLLEAKMIENQRLNMTHSKMVRDQLATGAAGTALLAAAPATAAAVETGTALTAARPIVQQVGTGIVDSAGKEIMKDITAAGPSILRAAVNAGGKFVIQHPGLTLAGATALVKHKLLARLIQSAIE